MGEIGRKIREREGKYFDFVIWFTREKKKWGDEGTVPAFYFPPNLGEMRDARLYVLLLKIWLINVFYINLIFIIIYLFILLCSLKNIIISGGITKKMLGGLMKWQIEGVQWKF